MAKKSISVIDLDELTNKIEESNIDEVSSEEINIKSPKKVRRKSKNKPTSPSFSIKSYKSKNSSPISYNKSVLKRAISKFKSNRLSRTDIPSSEEYIYEMDFNNINNNKNLEILDKIYKKIENKEIKNDKDEFLRNIFEIFKDKHYIMFLKKKKISYYTSENKCCVIPFIKTKKCNFFNIDNFHGCLFLPIEDIDKILLVLDFYNKIISKYKISNQEINYNKDESFLSIHIDENNIKKNYLYKRIDLLNKINFLSLKEYQTKITEYKIRGLCQIAEELGASEITIDFEKNLKNTILKETTINMEINSIAGNLGLKRSKTDSKDENAAYTLRYSSINNIELNDYKLINKIKKHYFIISEKVFNSSLELQYLLSSRCRHFITNYSTSFNIDTETVVDKELETKFKQSGYSVGLNVKNNKTISNHLKINTNIKFNSIDNYHSFITGFNLPYNESGFNHLMLAINYESDLFMEKGIYKIMNFIEGYISRILYYSNKEKYKKVKTLLELIKKRMTLNEYANCLLFYFNLNSNWIQFEYFINVLADEGKSIDDINYLIIYEKYNNKNNNLDCHDLIDDIVELIQNKCKNEGIEDKFNLMLRPTSMKTRYILKYFLIHDYKLFNTFNLYGLNNIITHIKKYNINIDESYYNNIELNGEDGKKLTSYKYLTLDEYDIKNEKFTNIYKNMNLSFYLWEFYTNMMTFIHEIYLLIFNYKLEIGEINIKNKIYYKDLFNNIINYFDFKEANITSFKLLNNYINDCINIIKLGLIMKDEILSEFKNQNTYSNIRVFFMNYIICNNKYSYFTIKLNFIINNNYTRLKEYLDNVYNSSIINNKLINVSDNSLRLGRNSLERPKLSNIKQISFDESEDRDSELIISNNEKFIYNIIKNIISYNHRNIQIDNIPLNSFGYNIIIKNFKVGFQEIEYNKLMIPFTNNMISYILNYNKIKKHIDYFIRHINISFQDFNNILAINNYLYKDYVNLIKTYMTEVLILYNKEFSVKNKTLIIPIELC
jgi:hypothetical protein